MLLYCHGSYPYFQTANASFINSFMTSITNIETIAILAPKIPIISLAPKIPIVSLVNRLQVRPQHQRFSDDCALDLGLGGEERNELKG